MLERNKIYCDDSMNMWTCRPCNRGFVSERAVYDHARNVSAHNGEWCERCKRLFVSPSAKASHDQNSSSHNICFVCHLDYSSIVALNVHLESQHYYCTRCSAYPGDQGRDRSRELLYIHQVKAHFKCKECGEYLENQNNVDQHQRVHLPRDKECYGCYRKFPSLSAMMIHLESGTCTSQVTIDDIDSWAVQYHRSGTYINRLGSTRYKCPTCESPSDYISGLMQHLESNACHGNINRSSGSLAAFLEGKIMNHSAGPHYGERSAYTVRV